MTAELKNQDHEQGTKPSTFCGLPLATAPKQSATKHKLSDHLNKLVSLVLESCIEGKDVNIKELAGAVGMKSANYAATALGHAKGGGLMMWKKDSAILACQENVAIALNYLYSDELPESIFEVAACSRGMDAEEFAAKVRSLPLASQALAA